MNNNICSICKHKDLLIDISKIKSLKIKIFINNNRINKEDYSIFIKKCNCKNKKAHKFCVLLNIIFNYELKCSDCNSFYNISVTKNKDNNEKCKIILLLILLIIIHIILYGCCAVLIIFNLEKFEMNDLKKIKDEKYINAQFFFSFILFVLNSYLFYKSIKYIVNRFKYCYKYYININDKTSSNIDDSKYFTALYNFYRDFNNDHFGYLLCKRNEIFFYNKITINKDYQKLIQNNNNEFKNISNGNKDNSKKGNNEEILKLNNNVNNNNMNDNEVNNDNMMGEKSKTEYLYKKWNPGCNGVIQVQNLVKKTSTIRQENKNKEHEDIGEFFKSETNKIKINFTKNNIESNNEEDKNINIKNLKKETISFRNIKKVESVKEEEKN